MNPNMPGPITISVHVGDAKMTGGYVYFITYENSICRQQNPYFKIGMAKDVSSRLSQLQTGSPLKLILAGLIESDDPFSLEQYLLKQFSEDRVCGEWVKARGENLKFIKTYKLTLDRFDELFKTPPVDEKDLKIEVLSREVRRLTAREKELESRLDGNGRANKKSRPDEPHHGKKIWQYKNWASNQFEDLH